MGDLFDLITSDEDRRRLEEYKAKLRAAGRWMPLFRAGFEWRRWGLSIELSFGDWTPSEWSVMLQIGPLYIGGGIEENLDWRFRMADVAAASQPTEGT